MIVQQKIYFLILTVLVITKSYGQIVSDSIYDSWWANKDRSIFQTVDQGTFLGMATGYFQIKSGNDTLVLDFAGCHTKLEVLHDSEEMYDKSTKRYSTQTTSGKTSLTYEVYALTNILSVNLNGLIYQIGIIDGASDMPISGLTFNYCPDKSLEFLTLFVSKPLELTTTRYVMKQKNISYREAEKFARTLTIIPGSTLVFVVNK